MKKDDAAGLDDPLLPLLAALDDALAAGDATNSSLDSLHVPEQLRPRLERDAAWCRMVRRLLPEAAANTVSAPVPATPLASGAPRLASLGRFRIHRELGRGGFGVVLLARDSRLGRDVALKIPRPEALVLPELRARFQHEARAAASLDHPNLVPVYEAGEADGICYIASAFCPGITLSQWLRERTEPVPCALAARLVATLAEGVEHAHRRGVLHRDLKPSNVILSPRAPGDSVRMPERRAGFRAAHPGFRSGESPAR